MISVTIDVAGFYFEQSVMVPEDSSILDVMEAVKRQTSLNRTGPRFDYSVEGQSQDNLFLDGIRVTHRNGSALTRQQRPNPRPYEDGVYEFYDDDVEEDNGRLRPRNPTSRFFVNAWQYYVYNAQRVDLGRLQATQNPTDRKIIALSRKPSAGGIQLGDNFLIVWRLIAIALRPTYGDSLKVAMRRGMTGNG
jgi:hypothetical protein